MRAALARLTQTPASESTRQSLDHLLNIMSPLLGDETPPTIQEVNYDDESILSNITDAKLDDSRLNSSTQSSNQTNKTPHKLSNQTIN